MNVPPEIRPTVRGKLFLGLLLGLAAAAAAHHGNPQAPAPAWNAYVPAGVPQPSAPAGPAR